MNWMIPTTYMQRLGHALELLCAGSRPPDEMIEAWLDTKRDDNRLQEFACQHGPIWSQGIALIDAARLMAEQPTEGVEHQPAYTQNEHYPEEWGPSDNRRLTCSCGNPDPGHMTPNASGKGPAL